jgi:hypothetical protein
VDSSILRLDAGPVDYVIIGLYFVVVLGIGYLARRQVSTSLDFLLSGRPARSPWDIRAVIGGLIGTYGLVLLVVGLFGTTDDDLAKADGTNLNLWTEAGLLVAAALMGVWVLRRPLRVPEPTADSG